MKRPDLALLATLVVPHAALAAPFCVEIAGVPPQCLYTDAAICRSDAQRQKGVCGVNLKEISPPPGQRFCSVSNGPAIECLFADRRSCDTAATGRKGVCIDAGPDNARPDPDRIPR